jgi:hypothetical protein
VVSTHAVSQHSMGRDDAHCDPAKPAVPLITGNSGVTAGRAFQLRDFNAHPRNAPMPRVRNPSGARPLPCRIASAAVGRFVGDEPICPEKRQT